MTCIKTGANVYLYRYGAIVHGDLHKLEPDGPYAFNYRGCEDWRYPKPDEEITVNIIIHGGDFMNINSTLIFGQNACGSFHYQGVTL